MNQTFTVTGMTCGHCEKAVTQAIHTLDPAAKVVIGQACRFVGQQAVQLHGGMGVTDELDVSHYFKRLMAIELQWGSTEHHLQAFAAALA